MQHFWHSFTHRIDDPCSHLKEGVTSMNEQLLDSARREVARCREKGLGEEDTLHMALDACVRYGREQGTVGEELSPEMRAAFEYVVHEAMNPEPIMYDCPYCPGEHAVVEHCPLKPRVSNLDDC